MSFERRIFGKHLCGCCCCQYDYSMPRLLGRIITTRKGQTQYASRNSARMVSTFSSREPTLPSCKDGCRDWQEDLPPSVISPHPIDVTCVWVIIFSAGGPHVVRPIIKSLRWCCTYDTHLWDTWKFFRTSSYTGQVEMRDLVEFYYKPHVFCSSHGRRRERLVMMMRSENEEKSGTT